jgi:ankyrin repeat protein
MRNTDAFDSVIEDSQEARDFLQDNNEFHDTPLINSSLLGDEVKVRELLAASTLETVNQENVFGFTALTRAAMAGAASIVQMLLFHGARVDHPDQEGMTPLIWATTRQHLDGANPNAKSRHGNSALHEAALRGYDKAIDLLVSRDAVCDPSNHQGWTPLMLALRKKQYSTAWRLIGIGASVDSTERYGVTVLMLAVMAGDHHIVSELLRRGADPDAVSVRGITALKEAESRQHGIIAAILRNASLRKERKLHPSSSF